MRLLCRDDHEPEPPREVCPPHEFTAAWMTSDEEQSGVIFCSMCGDVRPLAPPTIGPSHAEQPIHRSAEG